MANWLDAIGKQEQTFDPVLGKQTRARFEAERAAYGAKTFGIPVKKSPAANPKNKTSQSRLTGDAGLQRAKDNIAAANKVSAPKSTGSSGGSGGGGSSASASKSLADMLRVKGIEDIYAPALDVINKQRTSATNRYEKNSAQLKNIFDSLSGLAVADQARIKEQFASSIAAQQMAVADRTAEQRTATAAGTEQAVATGAERGGGDAMVVNPIGVAAEEGISRSNEYQTTWENLQRANQAQAEADTRTRGEGYGQQQVAALQDLSNSLEDRLLALSGNEAQVRSDIAAAKFGQETNVAQARYAEEVARRNAAASAAASSASAGANIPKLDQVRQSIGSQRFNALTAQLNTAYTRAYNAINPIDPATGTAKGKIQKPNSNDVLAAWRAAGGNPDLISQAGTIANSIYG